MRTRTAHARVGARAARGYLAGEEEEKEVLVVVVVVEEEVHGTEVVMKDRVEVGVQVGTESDDSCVAVGRCFLRFCQGLLSASTSLRRRFARARACGTDVNAGSTILLVSGSGSTSSRAAEAGHLVAAPTPGDDACSNSLRCCCSRAGDDGGELRGDEAG
jgi:hypothetical protein